MKRVIDYDRFSGIRNVVMACEFASPDERERAFKALVDCLVNKSVYKPDGTIVHWRDESVNYFNRVCPCLEQEEIKMMIHSVEQFYQKFFFAPCVKVKSLFSELMRMGIENEYKNVSLEDLFEEYRQETGYSPYEKVSNAEVCSFLSDVESSVYALY